ncbi:MAG: nicotinamide riboside transporter PnuC [Eubacteriales bacterium]|nr:nicotinamide riboside transporter PnuC [Eubacteriales bacterium]
MNKVRKFFEDWTIFEKIWLLAASALIIILSLIWGDSTLAILSSLAGVISVVLCAKGKIENYAFGLFQAITYAYLCFKAQIYGEVMYNILMVPMILIGIISWKKNMEEDDSEVKARNLSAKGWVILIVGSVAAVVGYSLILKILGGNFAFVDSMSTTLSIIATILMLARYSEQWLMWIVVNVVSVVLWVMALINGDSGAVTLVVMWTAYVFNSIYGYINWRKMEKRS